MQHLPFHLDPLDPLDPLEQKHDHQPISKKQAKRLKKKEDYQRVKKIKKEKEKARKKFKPIVHVEPHEHQPCSEVLPKRRVVLKERVKEGIKVVIDLSYWHLMTEKEQKSLVRQLTYCQNILKHSTRPLNLSLADCSAPIRELLVKQCNAQHWAISLDERPVFVFQKPLVYLTGDAEEQLTELEKDCSYIVGGLVDHNRYKRISYDRAQQYGIPVRKLPLPGVTLKSSCHLAVNHVVELLGKRGEGASWEECVEVIPGRKVKQE